MKRIILDNGLRIISLKKPKDFTARAVVGVNYGPIYDTEKTSGLSHFLEHMILQDTKRNSYADIVEKTEMLGGFIDAKTRHENLIFYGYSPNRSFKEILKILSDFVLNPAFKLKTFQKEKNIIFNEISELYDDLYEYVDVLFLNALYKNNPVKLPFGGTKNSVKSITLEHISRAYRKYFVPNNMVIGLFGNFPNASLTIINNAFKKLERKSILKPKFLEENKNPFKRDVIEIRKNIEQCYIQTGVKAASINHKDTYALDILSALLGYGTSSRLEKELRVKNGLAYFITSVYRKGVNYGYFFVRTSVKKQNTEKVIKLIKQEFEKLKEKNISKAELNKGKNIITSDYMISLDSPIDSSIKFVENEMLLGNVNKSKLYLEEIKSVTTKDILEVANKYFDEENFATAVIKPK